MTIQDGKGKKNPQEHSASIIAGASYLCPPPPGLRARDVSR